MTKALKKNEALKHEANKNLKKKKINKMGFLKIKKKNKKKQKK